MNRPAVFFDRDNTLIVSDGYLGDPDGVVLVAGAAEVVAQVRRLGYAAITFSNQSGVARGMFTEEDVHRVNSRLDELLADHDANAIIDRHEFCPHHPEAVVPRYRQASEFRKPAPGMIYQAARQLGLDLGRSWVIGDAPRDIEAGRAAGCQTILFKDPSLPRSVAADESLTVEPDFVAATLHEAANIIESHPQAENTATGADVAPTPLPESEELPSSGLVDDHVAVPGDIPVRATEPVLTGSDSVPSAEASSQEQLAAPLFPEAPAVAENPTSGDAATGVTAVSVDPPPQADATSSTSEVHSAIPESHDEPLFPTSPDTSAFFEEPTPDSSTEPLPSTAQEHDMEDKAAHQPVHSDDADMDEPDVADSGGSESVRRRSPPAVILAAKAAREAARSSVPEATPEVLREVARNAAREAALGITRDYSSVAADASQTADSPSARRNLGVNLSNSSRRPGEAVEPGARTSQHVTEVHEVEQASSGASSFTAEPVHPVETPAYQRASPHPAHQPTYDPNGLVRLEDIAEQILIELKRRNDVGADFSVSKLMAGITMVISLAVLVYAYLYKSDNATLTSLLLLGLMLQSITISLLIMGRQK